MVGGCVLGGVKNSHQRVLSSTYFKIKGNCSLKVLKFNHLKHAGENTEWIYKQRGYLTSLQ